MLKNSRLSFLGVSLAASLALIKAPDPKSFQLKR
jgi:hypothetical protein